MMTTSGAVKVVSDFSNLADIARAIGDSGKADKLDVLRDEFKASLEALRAQEKEVQDKISDSVVKSSENINRETNLNNWQKSLEVKETDLLTRLDAVTKREKDALEREKTLKQGEVALTVAKKDHASYRDVSLKSIEDIKKEWKAETDRLEAELTKRENIVSQREQLSKKVKDEYDAKISALTSVLSVGKS